MLPYSSKKIGVVDLIKSSNLGLCLIHPKSGYPEALPTKIFEYMAGGIPFVASNFPVICEIIKSSKSGIIARSMSPKDIAEAIEYFHCDQKRTKDFGDNGKIAIAEKYNWNKEEMKLINFYDQ